MKTLLAILTILVMAQVAGAAAIPLGTFPFIFQPPPPPPPIIDDAWIKIEGDNLLFGLFFTHQPDWVHERFQWFLALNELEPHPMVPSKADFIVRSDEIGNGQVKVCTAHPYGAGCPGGWGLDFGNLPTQWDGEFLELTFTAPIELFGDSSMSFDVMSLLDGAENDGIHGVVLSQPPTLIPPPQVGAPVQGAIGVSESSSLAMVGVSLIALAGIKRRLSI